MSELGDLNQEPMEPFDLKKGWFEGNYGLYETESNHSKIVRDDYESREPTEIILERYKKYKNCIESMKNHGCNIPKVDIVLGEKEGSKHVFLIVDRITGSNLEEIEKIPGNESDKFENFFLGYLSSVFEAYQNSSLFFSDMGVKQIMYGHKFGEKDVENNFYMIDVGEEGFISKKNSSYDFSFFKLIILGNEELSRYALLFGEGSKFSRIRQKFKEMYLWCITNKELELKLYFKRVPKHQQQAELLLK